MLSAALGFSAALGAFLIGAVIAESEHTHAVERQIEPIRDMFAAVFFVAVGLQIDPVIIAKYWLPVLAISTLTIVGKAVSCAAGVVLAGYPATTAVRVGLGLGQIGEFSFIIAGVGREAGVVSSFLYPVTVAVSAVTTLATPYLIRYADSIAGVLARLSPEAPKSFVRFYGGQFGTATTRTQRWRIPREALRPLGGALLSLGLVVALLTAARVGLRVARDRMPAPVFFEHDVEVLVGVGCGILSLPLLVSIWKRGSEIGAALSTVIGLGMTNRRIVTETFRFAFALVASGIFLLVAAPILPSGLALVVTLTLIALATVLFWRAVLRVQVRAEEVLRRAFAADHDEADEDSGDRQRRLVTLAGERYPFELLMEDLVLPLHPTAVNLSIRELALRSQTGATIAAIYRDEVALVNPDPDSKLLPGDVILLLGSRVQIQRAARHIGRLSKQRTGP